MISEVLVRLLFFAFNMQQFWVALLPPINALSFCDLA